MPFAEARARELGCVAKPWGRLETPPLSKPHSVALALLAIGG